MSGHSKWATIHRQKQVNDARRGTVFTKLAQAVTMAVKAGGGNTDPGKNFKLRLAIDRARRMNMPKENINRALERGTGEGREGNLVELTYEGFLPGGPVVLVDVLTDNKLRTAQQVRGVLEQGGGRMGGGGAVAYQFVPAGELSIKYKPLSVKAIDEQELEIIDQDLSDIERGESGWVGYCEKEKIFEIKAKLEKLGYEVASAEMVMKPINEMPVDDSTKLKIEAILTNLEDLDNVLQVWTNYA